MNSFHGFADISMVTLMNYFFGIESKFPNIIIDCSSLSGLPVRPLIVTYRYRMVSSTNLAVVPSQASPINDIIRVTTSLKLQRASHP